MSIGHRSWAHIFHEGELSFLRRVFDSRARQAADAEAEGDLRRAAHLWAQMGYPMRAVELMTRLGDASKGLEAQLVAWSDALQFLPPEQEAMRTELDVKIGLAVLESARARGAVGADAKERLRDAARRLESAERWSEAADAFELLTMPD